VLIHLLWPSSSLETVSTLVGWSLSARQDRPSHHPSMFRHLLYLFVTAGPAFSTVSLVNPLSGQLPQIARVNEPYSWSMSPKTFESSDGTIKYSSSLISNWLSFEPSTQTLHGTPSEKDEGILEITITAEDGVSSASSNAKLCITSRPPPTLRIPIEAQFYVGNPSLSSVFLLSPGSALATTNPCLRIPPGWSFSIGFRGDMFEAQNGLYYNALLADGSILSDWLEFNPDTITLNGVVPGKLVTPQTISLALHASDQDGYTSTSLPFDIVIASHELSLPTSSLPTINITANSPFNLSLSSPDDFHGVLVDQEPIRPSDVFALSIDVSQYAGWLKYDESSRTLSGAPPDSLAISGHLLPVTLTATFNQTLHTNVSLAIVPSYFGSPSLPSIRAVAQQEVHFNLVQYFSNATSGQQPGDVSLTAAFEPDATNAFLYFDPDSAQLTGTVPADYHSDSQSEIIVTFTAYSHITHSTSHTTLHISLLSPSRKDINHSRPRGLSASAHAQLVLGLAISFGLVGGLTLLGTLLAALRRCARVDDAALGVETARPAWSDKDRKWYGIGTESGVETNDGRGYGWTEKIGRSAMDIENPFEPKQPLPSRAQSGKENHGALGLGLQRVLTRTPSNPQFHHTLSGNVQSPGAVMRKAEFLGKIRDTVRKVSDKYTRGGTGPIRPAIGKPLLVMPTGVIVNEKDDLLPFEQASTIGVPSSDPFEDVDLRSYAASTVNTLTDSPTSSTEDRSIPRRRADFAPTKVHNEDSQDVLPGAGHGRKLSVGSDSSLDTNASVRTHAEEAVVQTATRATSVRSARSASAISYQSLLLESPEVAGTRPRLIPFTSATRVPAPRLPSSPLVADGGSSDQGSSTSGANPRVVSQTARVVEMDKGANLDELSVGIHYVRSLGGDHQGSERDTSAVFYTNPSTPTVSTHVRSSFSSLASSRQAIGSRLGNVKRILVRAGENFKFRVAVYGDFGGYGLVARLISGQPIPQFLKVDLAEAMQQRGAVEFSGKPSARDIGELNVGLYTSNNPDCVARVILEVVRRNA
jgi:axial budding pattern protein 2